MSALLSYHEKFPEDLKAEGDARFLEEDLAAVSGSSGKLIYILLLCFWSDRKSFLYLIRRHTGRRYFYTVLEGPATGCCGCFSEF